MAIDSRTDKSTPPQVRMPAGVQGPTTSAQRSPASPPMFLRNFWYMAVPAKSLRRGKMIGKKLLGQSVLLGREREGMPFAMRDLRPRSSYWLGSLNSLLFTTPVSPLIERTLTLASLEKAMLP